MLSRISISLALLLLSGCQTTFTGDPHIENGHAGCEQKCKGQGMALAGMVFMGEYTSGCVCTVPGQSASTRDQVLAAAESGAAAGSTGVVMQMRRQEEQQRTYSFR